MGGYIGDSVPQSGWLGKTVWYYEGWFKMITGVAHKHLKGAYKGLQKFLQCEWAFVQNAT